MKSAARGMTTSEAEVTNISKNGFWLLVGQEELFVPFREFPWFKNAVVSEILNVERPHTHHLYWPDLDVDLAVESIRHPEKYPLVAKPRQLTSRSTRTARRRAAD